MHRSVSESLRLNSNPDESLLHVSEMGVGGRWGRGHEVMLVGRGTFCPWV